jgi:hypothetical protein
MPLVAMTLTKPKSVPDAKENRRALAVSDSNVWVNAVHNLTRLQSWSFEISPCFSVINLLTCSMLIRWIVAFVFVFCAGVSAQVDTIHVISHNKTKVVTDPSKGYNAYPKWAVFPSRKIDYRKVVLYVKYQCPDSQHCGEWDYIDNVFLRRVGGAATSSRNIEIARLISPYGWRFDSTWSFTWHVDVTDFAFLLHDSVEVEFNHDGYESNTDRGWVITLDFRIIEGKPAMQCLGMDSLWYGRIDYGDSSKPIDSVLHRIVFTNKFDADLVRLRILQTGHGMDDSENCAEFCSKWRKVFFDDSLVNQKQIWRTCGDNPLYPQAGTWLFNRAGWCPGSMVQPDVYDYPIKGKSSHTVYIEMEPYINRSKPTANYHISAYLFYYKKPWAENDVSIEEIIIPSTDDEYSRLNPAPGKALIVIKNNGQLPLTSVAVINGVEGFLEPLWYEWTGHLAHQQSTEIALTSSAEAADRDEHFYVGVKAPNGKPDQFPQDNTMKSQPRRLPVYGSRLILAFLSNNDSTSNSYLLYCPTGVVIVGRPTEWRRPRTLYRDTLMLEPGCHTLVVSDTAGDGLDFWANPEAGYGYVRLLDINDHLLKAFNSDFGSGIYHAFLVSEDAQPVYDTSVLPIVNPFPISNPGKFTLDVFFNDPTNATIRILTSDSTQVVFDGGYANLKEALLPIDISAQPDGIYLIKVTADDKTVTRRIRVKHKD